MAPAASDKRHDSTAAETHRGKALEHFRLLRPFPQDGVPFIHIAAASGGEPSEPAALGGPDPAAVQPRPRSSGQRRLMDGWHGWPLTSPGRAPMRACSTPTRPHSLAMLSSAETPD